MRLLNAESLEVHEFGQIIPHYAILSHTWEKDEVLYHDILNRTARTKTGYNKVLGCCRLAKERGLKWVWIDTLCIDKTSSSELSEAINSMYKWYEASTVCFVYLWDVCATPESTGYPPRTTDLSRSRWFTRGWTLQELVAPNYVEFYTYDWAEIGTKRSLDKQIADRTGIPHDVLRGAIPLSHNVAERMSWASGRMTTREEDMAYCLMGFFGVNMPLLYGEGTKAFLRLQEQILKQEEDYTIFMWFQSRDHTSYSSSPLRGAWCSSPAEFPSNRRPRDSQLQPDKPATALQDSSHGFIVDRLSRQFPDHDIRVHCGLDYSTIQQLSSHDVRQDFDNPDPPTLSSRGIKLSLPLMKIKDSNMKNAELIRDERCSESLWLAWTYCKVDNRLLCLVLDFSGSQSKLDSRAIPHCLISIDESLRKDFALMQLELRPSGSVQLMSSEDAPRKSQFSSVNIESKSPSIFVDLQHPSPTTGYHVFPDNEDFVLVLACRFTMGRRTTGFQVSCGISDGQHWCTLDKESTSSDGFPVHYPVHQTYDELKSESKTYFTQISDRAVLASSNIPGLILTVAMRKSSLHTYQLDIGESRAGEEMPWVKLCLSRGLN